MYNRTRKEDIRRMKGKEVKKSEHNGPNYEWLNSNDLEFIELYSTLPVGICIEFNFLVVFHGFEMNQPTNIRKLETLVRLRLIVD